MDAWVYLRQVKPYLTKQQYRTIAGQIKSGDVGGAMKGMVYLYGKQRNKR